MAPVKARIPQPIGSGPILKALIQKMGCIPSMDHPLPADPRRVGPTQGEAVAGRVACLVQGIRAWYRREQCAAAEPVLRTRFPQYNAKAGHDDPLGESVGRQLGGWPWRPAGGRDVPLLYTPRWQAEQQTPLERRLPKTQALREGLGQGALKRREAIAQALDATLKRDHPQDSLTYRLVSTATRRKR